MYLAAGLTHAGRCCLGWCTKMPGSWTVALLVLALLLIPQLLCGMLTGRVRRIGAPGGEPDPTPTPTRLAV